MKVAYIIVQPNENFCVSFLVALVLMCMCVADQADGRGSSGLLRVSSPSRIWPSQLNKYLKSIYSNCHSSCTLLPVSSILVL